MSSGRSKWALLLVALVAMACAQLADAKKESLSVKDDSRQFIHVESFGFAKGGVHKFKISNFQVAYSSTEVQPPNDLFAGLFFYQADQIPIPGLNPDLQQLCKQRSPNAMGADSTARVFLLGDKQDVTGSLEASIDVARDGYWHFFFFNCESPVRTFISFDLELEQYNIVGGQRSYLPIGETSLPWLYLGFFVASLCIMALWLGFMRRNRQNVQHIHYLMTLVLFLKICVLFFEMLKFRTMKETGLHSGWDIMFYIFTGLKGLMLFLVIILIGTGWNLMKPFLQERDRKIIVVVLTIQVFTNVALVVLDETAPGASSWQTWSDLLHILDLICCCAVLIPIVWSVRHLRESAAVDGKARDSLNKLQLFRRFYLLVVCYVYFTRIVIALMDAALPYNLIYLSHIFSEIARLLFYCTAGYLFRPAPRNPYFQVSQDDADDSNAIEMTA